jgi:8-oxo-dGTP diphosphatase
MLVDQINFCPRCGSRLTHEQRAGRERPVCPSCDWVYFPDPKVAVVSLVFRDGQVLLARRVNTPQQGLWTLPGGFVDAGEDPARAAERECLEETGLTVQVTELVDVLSGQEHPRGAHILIVYRAEILSGMVKPGDDADRVAFFELNNLPPLAFLSTKQILNRIS